MPVVLGVHRELRWASQSAYVFRARTIAILLEKIAAFAVRSHTDDFFVGHRGFPRPFLEGQGQITNDLLLPNPQQSQLSEIVGLSRFGGSNL